MFRIQNNSKDRLARKARAEARTNDGQAYAKAEATNHNTGAFSAGAGAGVVAIVDGQDRFLESKANADAEFGLGGAIAEAGVNGAVYRRQAKDGSVSFLEANVGGGLGLGLGGVKAKVDAKVDAVHTKVKLSKDVSMDARLGLSASTGAEIGPAGVSFSFLGLGASVGRKTGISTPFGEFSFNF